MKKRPSENKPTIQQGDLPSADKSKHTDTQQKNDAKNYSDVIKLGRGGLDNVVLDSDQIETDELSEEDSGFHDVPDSVVEEVDTGRVSDEPVSFAHPRIFDVDIDKINSNWDAGRNNSDGLESVRIKPDIEVEASFQIAHEIKDYEEKIKEMFVKLFAVKGVHIDGDNNKNIKIGPEGLKINLEIYSKLGDEAKNEKYIKMIQDEEKRADKKIKKMYKKLYEIIGEKK